MQSARSACPHCLVPLRVRDRRLVGRRIDCPDCGRPLQITADGPDGLSIEKAPAFAAPVATPAAPAETPPVRPSSRFARMLSPIASPLAIAWSVALLCTVTLVAALWSTERPKGSAAAETAGTSAAVERSLSADNGDPQGNAPAAGSSLSAADPTAERLQALGRHLQDHVAREGHYPPGTIAADELSPQARFSWMAGILSHMPSGQSARPLLAHPWHSPLNDTYVRRRIPELQNPAVDVLVGPNGYPASHFAGMAGVGEDAALLPESHPRAGIFGYDRQTRLEDIRDGAAQTILIAGVRQNLGSWAAGGTATVRGFTQEPYVNGPDGFGTGQPESMLVLMADGSVRTVSTHTEPTIVRRMAAKADGLPLDAAVPGEPGDLPSPPAEAPLVVEVAPEPDVPDSVKGLVSELALGGAPPAPVRTIDFDAVFGQKIAAFRQGRAVPAAELLLLVEELAGVPIRSDPAFEDELEPLLERPVTLELEETTVGGVLAALAERIGCRFSFAPDGVILSPATSADRSE